MIVSLLGLSLIAVLTAIGVRRQLRSGDAMWTRTRSRRRRALTVVVLILGAMVALGMPAQAQIGNDCKEAPNPDRPGSGMVGVLDPAPVGEGTPDSVYNEVGYGGLVWHTYDLGCGPTGLRNPDAVIDTWTGNQVFNVAKVMVAATNGLHYALLDGGLLRPLDDLITTGTVALYNTVFTPWLALVALALVVILFRSIWRGDLATISRRSMWALGALWFASATYLTPLVYTHALDDVLINGTSQVQAGFLAQVGVQERDQLPTLLHEQVVYRNWLRGEFGSPTAPQANDLGRQLVRAQTWTKDEVAQGKDQGSADPKKAAFTDLATKMGSAYGYFQGVDGSRMGTGFLAAGQSMAFTLFQLLAKLAILLAQVLLRVLILAGPVIGLIGIVFNDVLRNIGKVIGAALLNVVVIAALAGMQVLVLTRLFDPARGFAPLTQLLLALLVTVIFLMVGRPLRRMWQMVELSVGAVGGALPGAPPTVFSRFRKRSTEPAPQDEFWEQVRTAEADEDGTITVGGRRGDRARERRVRPESQPIVVVAERIDRRQRARESLERSRAERGLTGGSTRGVPIVIEGEPLNSGPRAVEAARPAVSPLPMSAAGRPMTVPGSPVPSQVTSRSTDTTPVGHNPWDEPIEVEPVLVPSEFRRGDRQQNSPQRAELEVVNGRPVWVVFHPSHGLEFRDPVP
jgi:hypothetical protein